MEEGNNGNKKEYRNNQKDVVCSNVVRAGKRTYFIDVRSTRKEEYYLTVTESKRRFNRNGRFYFEKHKIFLYREDIDKFVDGLQEMIDVVKENNAQLNLDNTHYSSQENSYIDEDENEVQPVSGDFTDLDFDDLNS